MDQKSVDKVARFLARQMRPFRSRILRAGKLIGKWVAIAAVISATLSFVLDGTEFINKKVPAAMAFVAKTILLRETFRPTLVDRVIKNDPAYANLCVEESQVLDLDGNGDATDLLVTFFPRNSELKCPDQNETAETSYGIFKEVDWRGFWPRFALLRTISRSDIGNFLLGSGYKMTFEQMGPFLFGSLYETSQSGYAVYGYANGVLQTLGQYRPVGSLINNPQAEVRAQIGNRLILYAEEGMKSFELSPDGRFVTKSLSAYDIVELNNLALVIEDSDKMPIELVKKLRAESQLQPTRPAGERQRATKGGSRQRELRGAPQKEGRRAVRQHTVVRRAPQLANDPDTKHYGRLNALPKECDYLVFMNGSQIELKLIGEGEEKRCGAEIPVSLGTSIIANVACEYEGLLESKHFPWGRVYDPNESKHTISCPSDGNDDEGKFNYVLTIKLQ